MAILAMFAAACGDDNGGSANAGDLSGQKVNVQGTEVGTEGEGVIAGFVPFEKDTGVDVVFSGSRDFETNMRVAAEGGNLPDIAIFPQPGNVVSQQFASHITPLPDDVVKTVEKNFDPYWSKLVTVNGKVMGLPVKADVKSLVWYSPKTFKAKGYKVPTTWDQLIKLQNQIKTDGGTPWCVGIESGDATGWPFTDWVEDIMLRLNGPDVYDQWVQHKIPFDDPKVKEVVKMVGDIWFPAGNVLGGRSAIASTGFGSAGLPILTGGCLMHRQGNFFSANFKSNKPDVKFGEDGDVNAFYLPTMNDKFGDVLLTGGAYAVAFNDKPATMATLRFMASTAYPNARITANKGGYLSPNKEHDTSLYADELDRTFAKILVNANPVRFDASDLMPGEVGAGSFWKEGTNYVSGAIDVDTFVSRVEKSWPKQ
jgi:alpha-glucoside transport system substrate-binding protein